MKKSNYLLLGLLITLMISCTKETDSVTPGELAGRWKLIRIESLVDGPSILKPSGEKGEVFIQFLDNQLEAFTGTTTRNGFRGRFANLGDQQLRLEEFSTTAAPETAWGNELISRLEKIDFYSINSGNRQHLELYAGAEKIVLSKEN